MDRVHGPYDESDIDLECDCQHPTDHEEGRAAVDDLRSTPYRVRVWVEPALWDYALIQTVQRLGQAHTLIVPPPRSFRKERLERHLQAGQSRESHGSRSRSV